MTFTHIVAVAANQTIGQADGLPWDIPEDMAFFRKSTKGHTIIMGRKTFESMGKPLKHRLNIIITRQKAYQVPDAIVVESIDQAITYCKKNAKTFKDPIYIIGGGEIYRQTMSIVDRIFLTRIHSDFIGDATYPQLDMKTFKESASQKGQGETPSYTFYTYERILPLPQ